jgi:hypothetical protein
VSAHKLTPEIADSIIKDVARGLFLTQVALNNNLHPNTIRNWVRRGLAEDAEEPFLGFAERFAKAEIQVEARLIELVSEASKPYRRKNRQVKTKSGSSAGAEGGTFEESEVLKGHHVERGDWKAAAFLLERRFPKRWGERAEESAQRDSLDVQQLLDESASRGQDIDDLVSNPPPELEAALLRHKDRLLALLGVPQLPTAAK